MCSTLSGGNRMIGLNAGLEVARKALSAYQLALGVYSNNIAQREHARLLPPDSRPLRRVPRRR